VSAYVTWAEKGTCRIPLRHHALEDIELRLQNPGESPCFGTKQEDWQYVHLEQTELCADTNTGLPDPSLETVHAVSCDGNSSTYLRAVVTTVSLHMGAMVAKSADNLHLVAHDHDMNGDCALNTDWLNLGFGPVDLKSEF